MYRKISLCFAVLFLSMSPSFVRADDDPKDIIAKAIKAHGGEEVLSKLKASQSQNKGKLTLPGLGEVEFTQDISTMLPDKLSDTLTLHINNENIPIKTLVNGDEFSLEANGQPAEMTDPIKTSLKEALYLIRSVRLVELVKKDSKYEFSSTGEVKVEDEPAVGVRVSSKGQKDINLFFSKKTGLLVKFEHRTLDIASGTEVTEERIILEYSKFKGDQPLPKRVVVKRDGKAFAEAEVIEASLLEKLDDSHFKK